MDVKDILAKEFACECGKTHLVPMEEIEADRRKVDLPARLEALFGGKKVLIVCDANTGALNAQVAEELREAGFDVTVREYSVEGVLTNTEPVVGAAVIDNAPTVDGILAIGAGTITDLGRYVGSRMHTPFAHIMTAPSMDGYASDVAALIVGGKKKIFKDCVFPKAVYGDLDTLCAAPYDMVKSGFGDMLGKRTALADWVLSRKMTGENYCAFTARFVEASSRACMDNLDGIAATQPEAIGVLTGALCEAGVAMALAKDTRPASGSEHIFSHFLVESAIDEKRPVPSHGETVGFGSLISALLYEYLLENLPEELADIKEEMSATLIGSAETARMLDVSRIGSKVSGFLGSKEALGEMIRTGANPKKRYTIVRYLSDKGMLDDAIAYVVDHTEF